MKLPKIGDVVAGRYKIERVIARGGMGIVFAATQMPLGRIVALKVIIPTVDRNERLAGRFRREVELAMQLRHPNVVEIYDFGRDEFGGFYLVMEHLEGLDLKALLGQTGGLNFGRASEITLQTLDALSEAHDNSIIHRDLKPSNIFVTRAGRRTDFVKLLDFGVAKSLTEHASDLTQTGQVIGSLHYMSPENFIGEGVSYQADVYAMGLIFLEMLLGQRVVQGTNTAQLLMLHLNHQIRVPPPFAGTVLESVILRACARQPEQRFQNAAQMYDALEAAAEQLEPSLKVDPAVAPKYLALIDSENADLDEMAASMRKSASELSNSNDRIARVETIAAELIEEPEDFVPDELAKTTMTPPPRSRGNLEQDIGHASEDATIARALPGDARRPTTDTAGVSVTEPPKKKSVFLPWLAVLTLIVVSIIAVVVFISEDVGSSEESVELDVNSQQPRDPVETDPAPEIPPEDTMVFEEDLANDAPVVVNVGSMPVGAIVKEDGEQLGMTPLEITVDADARVLSVEKEGFEPKSIEVTRQDGEGGVNILLEAIEKKSAQPVRASEQKDSRKATKPENGSSRRKNDESKQEKEEEKKSLDDILKMGKFE